MCEWKAHNGEWPSSTRDTESSSPTLDSPARSTRKQRRQTTAANEEPHNGYSKSELLPLKHLRMQLDTTIEWAAQNEMAGDVARMLLKAAQRCRKRAAQAEASRDVRIKVEET